jgi:hypothetical protein
VGEGTRVKGFVGHWGWIYVVYQMAEFFRESRNEQYDKNIIEFYNDLAFMKDKGQYDLETMENQMRANRNG